MKHTKLFLIVRKRRIMTNSDQVRTIHSEECDEIALDEELQKIALDSTLRIYFHSLDEKQEDEIWNPIQEICSAGDEVGGMLIHESNIVMNHHEKKSYQISMLLKLQKYHFSNFSTILPSISVPSMEKTSLLKSKQEPNLEQNIKYQENEGVWMEILVICT